MRKLFIIAAFVTVGVVASSTAIANYFYPGRVIIGYGPPPPPPAPPIGGNANVGPDPCLLENEIECECFADLSLLEACAKTPVQVGCLGTHTEYVGVSQYSPVLLEGATKTLGELRCSGLSKDTAYVVLPLPK